MSSHTDLYWILLLSFICIRTGLARLSKHWKKYFYEIEIGEKEAEIYVNHRNHLIILSGERYFRSFSRCFLIPSSRAIKRGQRFTEPKIPS